MSGNNAEGVGSEPSFFWERFQGYLKDAAAPTDPEGAKLAEAAVL